jgi:hypothetical protein
MNAETLASGAGESPRTPYPLSPPLRNVGRLRNWKASPIKSGQKSSLSLDCYFLLGSRLPLDTPPKLVPVTRILRCPIPGSASESRADSGERKTNAVIYRYCATGSTLLVLVGMSCLYYTGRRGSV